MTRLQAESPETQLLKLKTSRISQTGMKLMTNLFYQLTR